MSIPSDKPRLSAETFDEFLAAQGDLDWCETAALEEIVRDQAVQPPTL